MFSRILGLSARCSGMWIIQPVGLPANDILPLFEKYRANRAAETWLSTREIELGSGQQREESWFIRHGGVLLCTLSDVVL